ncbi:hypothetical protein TNIN_396211 [Trichonephila inaurata madagascariensis]|uniref:Uncharacterized protein n=1 Tax=Trichonephila inaurata madagascariensis TaxID=2747483 RepID=A0A8X6X5H4_9ARAC|nr:hypothetical protein TNIN_396211 [Trichonephila inaurata madagascariensis]
MQAITPRQIQALGYSNNELYSNNFKSESLSEPQDLTRAPDVPHCIVETITQSNQRIIFDHFLCKKLKVATLHHMFCETHANVEVW